MIQHFRVPLVPLIFNILRAGTKFWGKLAWGPALFQPLVFILHNSLHSSLFLIPPPNLTNSLLAPLSHERVNCILLFSAVQVQYSCMHQFGKSDTSKNIKWYIILHIFVNKLYSKSNNICVIQETECHYVHLNFPGFPEKGQESLMYHIRLFGSDFRRHFCWE